MKKYIKRLEALDAKDTLFPAAQRCAFILSGQSDFAHSELSSAQKGLLSLFKERGYAVVETGFPYNRRHDFTGCKRAGIAAASLRNMLQYYHTVTNDDYKKLIAKHLQPVFAQTEEIVIVCQSAGLNMLKAAVPFLNIGAQAKITVFALGPVARGSFYDRRFALVVVKGREDWVSWFLDKQKVDYWVDCNHLNYCRNGELRAILDGVLENEDQN